MVNYKNVLDQDKCIFCLNCIVVCPQRVFEPDYEKKKAYINNPESCIACLNCEQSCPVGAVKVVGDVRVDWKIPPERWPDKAEDPRFAGGDSTDHRLGLKPSETDDKSEYKGWAE